jgi:hypothetical protein
MRFAKFMVNVCIHNHSSKEFVDEEREMVGILIVACGTKHNELWRLQK